MPQHRGFTLIELLVVIAIIAILASVVMTSLATARMKSRDTRRVADLAQIRTALELYYDDYGYYPPSACGWDCNDYRYSYNATSWNLLAQDLKPYLATLPVDPINSPSCPPWGDGCYTYAYGNVGRVAYPGKYDLTAQLEDPNSQLRCAVKHWTLYFNDQPWCGIYSEHLYEASP